MCCCLDHSVSLSSVEILCFLFSSPDLTNLFTGLCYWTWEFFMPISYYSGTQFVCLPVFKYIKTFEVSFHTSCNNRFSHFPRAFSHESPCPDLCFSSESLLKTEAKYSFSFQSLFPLPALCFLNNNHNPFLFIYIPYFIIYYVCYYILFIFFFDFI